MASENSTEPSHGRLRAFWQSLSATKTPYLLGSLLVVSAVVGILGWGGFNWALEITNTEAFCISCHEMRENVYQEYTETIHNRNPAGVRATCPDCHVPKEWIYKLRRKVFATNELFHWMLGTVDTKEKFNGKRLELASHVWDTMKETDSRECRNCHTFGSMETAKQGALAQRRHEQAETEGKTCINCHKGIAHDLENRTCLRCHGDILDVATRSEKVANPHRVHLLSKDIAYKGDNRDCLTCHEMITPTAKAGVTAPKKEGWRTEGDFYHPNSTRPEAGVWKKLVVRPDRIPNLRTLTSLQPLEPHPFKPSLKRLVCIECHGPDSKTTKTFYGAPIVAK